MKESIIFISTWVWVTLREFSKLEDKQPRLSWHIGHSSEEIQSSEEQFKCLIMTTAMGSLIAPNVFWTTL